MNQQPQDLINRQSVKNLNGYKWLVILPLIAFIFCSGCKNDLEKIHLFEEKGIIPNLSGKQVTILRSDSARLSIKIVASKILRYDNIEEPFMEFPEGVEVFFLDSVQNVKTYITAKYAIRYEQQALYYARDSVVARDVKKDDWIKSEEMFWDEKRGIIYSNKFTTTQRFGKIIYGQNGFTSNQDLSHFVIRKSKSENLQTTNEHK